MLCEEAKIQLVQRNPHIDMCVHFGKLLRCSFVEGFIL